ncbi:MAG: prepilin-type N-terminal cleavage/methylation domain-containing protein [Acidobacteriota bacterium]
MVHHTQRRERGVTLFEMLIVVALIGLIAGFSYPSVVSGLDTLRMRTASDQVVSFFSAALDRADRRQQVVEIQILPAQNKLIARSSDLSFMRQLIISDPARIVAVYPALPGVIVAEGVAPPPRRFLLYPGGAVPAIGVELATFKGRRRLVHLDPMTGTARAEVQAQ